MTETDNAMPATPYEIELGSFVEVEAFFDITILPDQSDGLPRTDIFLSFTKVTRLPDICMSSTVSIFRTI